MLRLARPYDENHNCKNSTVSPKYDAGMLPVLNHQLFPTRERIIAFEGDR